MILGKINTYLLVQVSKFFFLILFILLSIAWLLQVTRLFTITNFIHIEVLDIILLSFYLIPNIITVILPFILIFGLLLCFIKLNKDNELIAILSSGLGLEPFKKTILFFSIVVIVIFTILNFYIAPKIYENYKIKEYDLRNTLDFKNISFSNFLNLNNSTILDFKKENNEYHDIFISFDDEKENIVYAKRGNIFSENNEFNFQLTNGFKISIDKNKQIEKLEFLSYILKIDNKNISSIEIEDKNTFTIIDDLNAENYLNFTFKIIDIILIIFVIIFFYNNNLKENNFYTYNNIYFSLSSIGVLILNQILKNTEVKILTYLSVISIVIISSLMITFIKKKYEKN